MGCRSRRKVHSLFSRGCGWGYKGEGRANKPGKTTLRYLWLPQSLRRADLTVLMPKMKTHPWVGVTLSMKNLFGVMPGICYGWPKNVLHQAGIPESILDIVAAVNPHLAIQERFIEQHSEKIAPLTQQYKLPPGSVWA